MKRPLTTGIWQKKIEKFNFQTFLLTHYFIGLYLKMAIFIALSGLASWNCSCFIIDGSLASKFGRSVTWAIVFQKWPFDNRSKLLLKRGGVSKLAKIAICLKFDQKLISGSCKFSNWVVRNKNFTEPRSMLSWHHFLKCLWPRLFFQCSIFCTNILKANYGNQGYKNLF